MMEVLVKDCIMPTLYNSASAQDRLETVNLDSALGNALLGEELRNLYTLITLELDDLAGLLIIDEGTVAGKFLSVAVSQCDVLRDASKRIYLLKCLQKLLGIILW